MTHFLFPSIPTDPSFSHLKGIVNGYLQGENGNLVKNKLFIPLNLNDNHWVLITVTRDARQIIYFDPLGNPIPEQLNSALKSDDCFPVFALIDMRFKLQKDSDNCGPWVVEFAKKIIVRADINEKEQFDSIDIIAARKQHHEILFGLSYQDSAIISPRIDSSKTNSPKTSRLSSPAHTNASNNSHTHSQFSFFGSTAEDRNRSSSTSPSEDCEDMYLKMT